MTWLVILAVGAGSFLFRLGPLLAFQRIVAHRARRSCDPPRRYGGDHRLDHCLDEAQLRPETLSCRPCWRSQPRSVLAARGASMLRLLVCGGGIYACSVIAIDLLAR